MQVFEVPEAVQKKLLRYAPVTKPTWNPKLEFDTRQITKDETQDVDKPDINEDTGAIKIVDILPHIIDKELNLFKQLANIHTHPGCLDFCLKSIPIKPWIHQIKILYCVAQKLPFSFLIADEVGLGKTIETGSILCYLILSQKVKRVLILAHASVQPQWQEELGITFTQSQPQIWEILYKQQNYIVTLYPDVYDEKPSLRLMNFGEPLFEELLSTLVKFLNTKELT